MGGTGLHASCITRWGSRDFCPQVGLSINKVLSIVFKLIIVTKD